MRFSNWQNKFTALWLIALLLVAVGLGVTWLNKDIHIQTNIFALLPKVQQDPELARTQQYMNEQLNNKVFVVVDAKDEAAIQQATHFLTAQAKQSQLWQPLKPQLDFDQFAKQLYQHRTGLLSAQDQALLQKKRTMLR